jgi:hypothetical protein
VGDLARVNVDVGELSIAGSDAAISRLHANKPRNWLPINAHEVSKLTRAEVTVVDFTTMNAFLRT